jgi:DNA-binding MarR family transcriptional regulator
MSALAETLDVTALAEALRPALLRLSRRLRLEAHRAGLSMLDALILGAVKKNPGVGVSALAEAEQTSKPTMSAHIMRLTVAGLLERSSDAADRRRSGLAVTAAGARKLDTIRRQRNDWLAVRLSKLTAQERDALAAAVAPLLRLTTIEP